MIGTQAHPAVFTGAIACKEIISAGASGGGEVTYATLQPAEGEIWVVHSAVMFHDDVAARVQGWYVFDNVTSLIIYQTAAVAAGTMSQLYYTAMTQGFPLVLTSLNSLKAGITAGTAGKKVTIRALVTKLQSVEIWSNS